MKQKLIYVITVLFQLNQKLYLNNDNGIIALIVNSLRNKLFQFIEEIKTKTKIDKHFMKEKFIKILNIFKSIDVIKETYFHLMDNYEKQTEFIESNILCKV